MAACSRILNSGNSYHAARMTGRMIRDNDIARLN
jgi:hypothetical protein